MSTIEATHSQEPTDKVTVIGPFIIFQQMSPDIDPVCQQMLNAIEVIVATGGRPVLLVVLGEHAAPPSARMRAALAATRRRHASKLAAIGLVVQGKGFASAVHRSVISAIQLVQRVDFPERAFATAEDAAGWLERYLPEGHAIDVVSVARATVATRARQLAERLQ